MRLLTSLWLSALACFCACGARPDLQGSTTAPACALPPLAPDGPFTEEACAASCTLGGTDEDGNPVRLECDGQRCLLFVEGVHRCTCTELDHANACANGVPVCRDVESFDFAAVTSLGCAPHP